MKEKFYFLVILKALFLSFNSAQAEWASLDEYLHVHGYFLSPLDSRVNEGYCTFAQQQQFIQDLDSYSQIKQVAEIGFNAGHSAELFLKHCPQANLVSFDLNSHDYTEVGVAFMKEKYGEKFEFIQGDSRLTIPTYATDHPEKKFDLIYVDGGHSLSICYADIMNCKQIASKNCLVWVDDYWGEVKDAVDFLEKLGIIQIFQKKEAHDNCGSRSWVIVSYVDQKD